jgi:hypothetical protein
MKARTPFWPLLKNELALRQGGGAGPIAAILAVYWLCVGSLPFLVLFGDPFGDLVGGPHSRGNIASLFDADFLPIMTFEFLGVLTLWITYATVPAFCDLLSPGGAVPGAVQHAGDFEFLFTRAVDRRILFRARATAFFILALTPLILNVVASPFAPDLTFSPVDAASAEAVRRYDRYQSTFPAWRLQVNAPRMYNGGFPTVQMAIPHGAVAYTAWLAWSGTLAVLLLQAYGTLIARRVKANHWWTAFYPGAPMIIVLLLLILAARVSLRSHINLYENSFLFFSAHPLAMVTALALLAVLIQTWCERRFSQLEIL